MLEREKNAIKFAKEKHKDQKYGELPYFYHLLDTVMILKSSGLNAEEILIAGYLHDTVEDTDTTIEELIEKFGEIVADMVYAVSDPKGLNSRKERKDVVYRNIENSKYPLFTACVKVADRIANLKMSVGSGNIKKIKMYCLESKEFENRIVSMIEYKASKLHEAYKYISKEAKRMQA